MWISNSHLCHFWSRGFTHHPILPAHIFWGDNAVITPLIRISQREPGMEQPSPGIHGHHPSWNALCCLCHGQGELLGVWGGQQSPRGTHGSLFLLQVPRPRLGPARRWPHVALHPRHRPDPRPGPSCPLANPPSAMWYVGTGWGHGRGVAGDIPGLEWGDGGDGVTRRHRDGLF